MDSISQRELRNDSGSVMRRVEQGESFVITRNGRPVADLVPHDRSTTGRPRRFVPVADVAAALADMPEWGAGEWAEDLAALDRAVDNSIVDPWTRE